MTQEYTTSRRLAIRLRGLSTIAKPTSDDDTDVREGTEFEEVDTGDVYYYDQDEEWYLLTRAGETTVDERATRMVIDHEAGAKLDRLVTGVESMVDRLDALLAILGR